MELLSTKHGILKENYETLIQDYKCRQDKLNHLNGYIDCMKMVFENQVKALEVKNQNLVKEFEKERKEKEKCVKNIEEMEKMEDELRIKNQELLIEKEELIMIENKYKELTQRIGEVETESSELTSMIEIETKNLMDHDVNKTVTVAEMDCSHLEPHYGDGENLIGQEGNNDVTVHVGIKTTIPKSEQVVDELQSNGDMMDMRETQVEIKKVEPNHSLTRTPNGEPYENKSHYDGDNEKDEVIVVEEHNANKSVKEKSGASRYDDDEVIVVERKETVRVTIEISDDDDDMDVEYFNPPRENSNINLPRSFVVGVKQEQTSDGGLYSLKVSHEANTSKANLASSSSSSSDEFVFLPFHVKKPGVDSN